MGKKKNSAQLAPEEISRMAADELKAEAGREEELGFDFYALFMRESLEEMDDADPTPNWECFWTVSETRVGKDTYKIFFDPELRRLGLSMETPGHGVICLGYYSS